MSEQQVSYNIPGMDDVHVEQGHVYYADGTTQLAMDIYRAPQSSSSPVVIFVFGFPDAVLLANRGQKLKDRGQSISWSRLVAASGLTAITYETANPAQDVLNLITYIRENAETLNIDRSRIGLWSCSGNVPTVLSVLMQQPHEYLRCAVMYYGFMLDWEGSHIVTEAAANFGFVNPNENKTYDDLPQHIPLFIVRAGLDSLPIINATIDHFLSEAVSRNLPLTFVNYTSGQHGFDVVDSSLRSQEIIKDTLKFMIEHLQGFDLDSR
ncbi:MAG: hypothetical protein L0154_13900 [Chloroflexi bacterium]|nr:hypothetical protein [Chloroflexota bacterium]